MYIRDLIGRNGPIFSFEFFPPKTPQGEENLYRAVDQLRELAPSFVSVTYGAGGTTRDKTVELVCRIKHDLGIEAMAHLTCVGSDRDHLYAVLQQLRTEGIDNVLALRGDPPREQTHFVAAVNGFAYAAQLVEFIRAQRFPFSLGGAGYPEGHVECRDLAIDLLHLKAKVDAGLDFVITQLFFDNRDYFTFVERAQAHGITIPIIPGIMPITNLSQIERFTALCGARIPDSLRAQLEEVRNDEAQVRAIGVAHATAQCRDLLMRGAPGVHFYTLNQSPATRAILQHLRR